MFKVYCGKGEEETRQLPEAVAFVEFANNVFRAPDLIKNKQDIFADRDSHLTKVQRYRNAA